MSRCHWTATSANIDVKNGINLSSGEAQMEVTSLKIAGKKLELLIDKLKPTFKSDSGEVFTHVSDHTVILVSENFYFRVSSNLLSVLIINTADNDQYEITVVTGGGASGFFRMTLDSERHRNKKVLGFIETICTKNGWSITEVKTIVSNPSGF